MHRYLQALRRDHEVEQRHFDGDLWQVVRVAQTSCHVEPKLGRVLDHVVAEFQVIDALHITSKSDLRLYACTNVLARALLVHPAHSRFLTIMRHTNPRTHSLTIGNESVPIQPAQCWFPGLAISDARSSTIWTGLLCPTGGGAFWNSAIRPPVCPMAQQPRLQARRLPAA